MKLDLASRSLEISNLQPVSEGYNNDVWRGETSTGVPCIVKKFRQPVAYVREVWATDQLQTLGLVHSPILASKQQETIVYQQLGKTTSFPFSITQVPEIATYLGQLHRRSIDMELELMDGAIENNQPNVILSRLRGTGYSPSFLSFVHGDVCPGNCIFQEGRFLHFIDFEEAGLSDPLIDLAIALLECCDDHQSVVEFENAYFQSLGLLQLESLYRQTGTRKMILQHSLEVLRDWAIENECYELLEKYRGVNQNLLEGLQ